MIKKFSTKVKLIIQVTLSTLLVFALVLPTSAISTSTDAYLDYFAENNIFYYNPKGADSYGCNTIVANCDIRGTTREERLWSGIRNYGFSPEQTAAIMGNTLHEAGTPVRQEDAYNIARDHGVLTQQGNPYTIWTYDNETHSSGMEAIYSNYRAGKPITGIGLGIAQWSYKTRRENYLNIMKSHGLLKYFEGDAYKTYGKISSDDALREKIVEETGSEAEYWALWCAMLEFMAQEFNSNYTTFFSKGSVDEMANYVAATYENCSGCQAGGSQNTIRRQEAANIYQKYKDGVFDAVENGTASSVTAGASGVDATATSSTETGSNVLIIGDSITNRAQMHGAFDARLPDALINAQDGRTFQEGIDVLKSLPESDLRKIVVFALGSNGGATEDRAKEVINYLGNERKVIFVTDYSLGKNDYTQANTLFNSLAGQFNNVIVADWASAVSSNPTEYIADEGSVDVHPTITAGTDLFAKVIYEAVTNGTLHAANNQICSGVTGEYTDASGLPSYKQCDPAWGNLHFGIEGVNGSAGSTICASGCGPTSFAMLATILLGKEILPPETNDIAGKAGMYVSGAGSSHAITQILANHYGLQYQKFPSTSGSSCIETVNNALNEGWMLHVSGGSSTGTGAAPFTPGGHYVGIVGLTTDGNWLVVDSAGGNDHQNRAYTPQEVISAGLNCSNLNGIRK